MNEQALVFFSGNTEYLKKKSIKPRIFLYSYNENITRYFIFVTRDSDQTIQNQLDTVYYL